eukprot:5274822-Ditylum_brightwellii.AAC.1
MKFERGYFNQGGGKSQIPKHLFLYEHPGKHAVFLRESEHFKVPTITANEGFHDIADLAIELNNVSERTKSIRESYGKKALVVFIPFRTEQD